MLTVSNLTKKFNQQGGVDKLSFSVKPKEIFALIGPNGAGKTTTIKTILGLYQKDSGTVSFFGERQKIGYIPDEPVFYPYLTGYEVLDFIRILYGISQKEFHKRLAHLFAVYPIASILNDYPENYSRGNKQKLSIICALLHEPKLLLVDEPIVGLDPQSSEKTIKLFSDFASGGGMILLSTHTLSFVEKVATHIGIIDRGKLIFEGSRAELTTKAGKNRSLASSFMSLLKND